MPLAEHDFPEASRRHSLIYVSIHVPLAEHDVLSPPQPVSHRVSIHVPLAEHDSSDYWRARQDIVSIHVPLAEHDLLPSPEWSGDDSFNSRAPRGARPMATALPATPTTFQFTCPSRSTTGMSIFIVRLSKFQFTCPSRSTTGTPDDQAGAPGVSIHVPLAEHDLTSCPGKPVTG